MSLTTNISTLDLWNIAKNLEYKEIPVMESVCKSWQTILRSDYVISLLFQNLFPEYNVLPNIPLSLQYRQMQYVPFNIARGIFRISEVEIGGKTVFESKAHRVSLEFNRMYVVENKTNENFPGYSIYSDIDPQLTPDESVMITAKGNVLKFRDTSDGNCLKNLTGHKKIVQGVRIHSNGKSAVSICQKKVITWDLMTWKRPNIYSMIFIFEKFEIMADRGLVFFTLGFRQGLVKLIIGSDISHVDTDEHIKTMISTPDQKMLLVSTGWKIDVMKVDTMEVLRCIPFPSGICRLHETGYTRSVIGEMRFTTYGTELFLRECTSKSYAVVLHFFDLNKDDQKLLTYDEFERTHSPEAIEMRLKE